MNEKLRPLILLTNDDGFEAPGLRALAEAVAGMGDVIAAAPETAQSGKSSAITVEGPLFIKERGELAGAQLFSINGTPVDCVKLALDVIVPRKPALVLSGINHGSNTGNAVIYSGTMGAAQEACMAGVPSVGFSLTHHSIAADFSLSLPLVKAITASVLEKGLPEGVCLNVNIPAKVTPKGARAARAARGYWTDEYERYRTPSGQSFYWLKGEFINIDADRTDTDEYWLSEDYISVVPVAPENPELDLPRLLPQIQTLLP
ncbi:MAG: 5'/3'-nucleotidase SurE [Candidatus Amulumruptor caecigallinarius]|nr:5'/3'-nucleotidase SurE [Candidatus Amulumruptor caecigallinarius]MCM1396782.1 5'/3'-nucleotidase SurE [Candidatus Amulumruptor caecigallinarius]MCM1454523.1 5'/3'-nucleotidase SurE [bacterium]